MALPNVPEERAYGTVQEQEQLEAAAPAPIEASPEQMDTVAQEAVMQTAQEAMGTGAEPDDMGIKNPPSQDGYTVRNPYMLLPARMNYANFQQTPQKTQVERNYDVGLLWEVLASDPQADPTTRMIARSLMGVEEPD